MPDWLQWLFEPVPKPTDSEIASSVAMSETVSAGMSSLGTSSSDDDDDSGLSFQTWGLIAVCLIGLLLIVALLREVEGII